MDKEYLKDHLRELAKLIAPKEFVNTAYAKKINGNYVFGYYEGDVNQRNEVTKPVAICLAVSIMAYQNNLCGNDNNKGKHKRK